MSYDQQTPVDESRMEGSGTNRAGLPPFFSTPEGQPTVATPGDLTHAIHVAENTEIGNLSELERYWAVYPYSFISICESTNHGELRYFVVEPYISEPEIELYSFLTSKIQSIIRDYDTVILSSGDAKRRAVIRETALELMNNYGLLPNKRIQTLHNETEICTEEFQPGTSSVIERTLQKALFGDANKPIYTKNVSCDSHALSTGADDKHDHLSVVNMISGHPLLNQNGEPIMQQQTATDGAGVGWKNGDEGVWGGDEDGGEGVSSQSESAEYTSDDFMPRLGLPKDNKRFQVYDAAVDEKGVSVSSDGSDIAEKLTEYQVYKLLYYIEREFIGFKKIDPIKNDDAVEDITSPGYNSPVYVYHESHENMRTNIIHSEQELDDFVTALAQMSGEELSRRKPKTDAKLPDGSRAELTLGSGISEFGSDYTIRQFKEIPHTPIDLVNWETYGINQMALLWLFVEYGRSIMIAGGTGAGKTTTLNALSLFIPANKKLVSIEDTQEIELPHQNWQAYTTRDSGDLADEGVDVDEFDLLKAGLRKRPDRIILGEIRGREAFELFQSIRTGHPGLTTFHATSFNDVINRMSTEPIGVPHSVMTAIDLLLIQGEVSIGDENMRRNRMIAEISGYETGGQNSDPQVLKNTISEWDARIDEQMIKTDDSAQLDEIQSQSGWDDGEEQIQIRRRRVILAAIIVEEISEYHKVSATIQASMVNPDDVLRSIAKGKLSEDVHRFEEGLSNISAKNESGENSVDRPTPSKELRAEAESIIQTEKANGILSKYA